MAYELSNCIALGVGNMSEAASFYERVLGYKRKLESPGFIEMDTGALRLFLCHDEVTAPTFEMLVDDVSEASEYLAGHGFRRQAEESGEVYMSDPFGYVYCVTKRHPVS